MNTSHLPPFYFDFPVRDVPRAQKNDDEKFIDHFERKITVQEADGITLQYPVYDIGAYGFQTIHAAVIAENNLAINFKYRKTIHNSEKYELGPNDLSLDEDNGNFKKAMELADEDIIKIDFSKLSKSECQQKIAITCKKAQKEIRGDYSADITKTEDIEKTASTVKNADEDISSQIPLNIEKMAKDTLICRHFAYELAAMMQLMQVYLPEEKQTNFYVFGNHTSSVSNDGGGAHVAIISSDGDAIIESTVKDPQKVFKNITNKTAHTLKDFFIGELTLITDDGTDYSTGFAELPQQMEIIKQRKNGENVALLEENMNETANKEYIAALRLDLLGSSYDETKYRQCSEKVGRILNSITHQEPATHNLYRNFYDFVSEKKKEIQKNVDDEAHNPLMIYRATVAARTLHDLSDSFDNAKNFYTLLQKENSYVPMLRTETKTLFEQCLREFEQINQNSAFTHRNLSEVNNRLFSIYHTTQAELKVIRAIDQYQPDALDVLKNEINEPSVAAAINNQKNYIHGLKLRITSLTNQDIHECVTTVEPYLRDKNLEKYPIFSEIRNVAQFITETTKLNEQYHALYNDVAGRISEMPESIVFIDDMLQPVFPLIKEERFNALAELSTKNEEYAIIDTYLPQQYKAGITQLTLINDVIKILDRDGDKTITAQEIKDGTKALREVENLKAIEMIQSVQDKINITTAEFSFALNVKLGDNVKSQIIKR